LTFDKNYALTVILVALAH